MNKFLLTAVLLMVFYVNFAYSMQRGDVELTEIQPDSDDGGYETDDVIFIIKF